MPTKRQIALMNQQLAMMTTSLNQEQQAILAGFQCLPLTHAERAVNYQKAAESENAKRNSDHSLEIVALRADFTTEMNQALTDLRQEMNKSITVKFDKLSETFKNDMISLDLQLTQKIEEQDRDVLIQIENDILALKLAKKPFPWDEVLILCVILIAVGVMSIYSAPERKMVGY